MEIKKTLTEGLLTLEYGPLSSHILLIRLNESLDEVSARFKEYAVQCSPIIDATDKENWEKEMTAFDLIPPIELRCMQDRTLTAVMVTSIHKQQGLSFLEFILENINHNTFDCREDYQRYFTNWFQSREVPLYKRAIENVKGDKKMVDIEYEVQLHCAFLRDALGHSIETSLPIAEYRAEYFGLHENKTIFNHPSGLWMVISEGVAKNTLKDTRKRLADRSYLLSSTENLEEPFPNSGFHAARLHPFTEARLSVNGDGSNYYALQTLGLSSKEVKDFHRNILNDGELEIREPRQVNIQNTYKTIFIHQTHALQRLRKSSAILHVDEALLYQAMSYGVFLQRDKKYSHKRMFNLVKNEYRQLPSNAQEMLRIVFKSGETTCL